MEYMHKNIYTYRYFPSNGFLYNGPSKGLNRGVQNVHKGFLPAIGLCFLLFSCSGLELNLFENTAVEDLDYCQLLRHFRIRFRTKHLVIYVAEFMWKQNIRRICVLSAVQTLSNSLQNKTFGEAHGSNRWKEIHLEILNPVSC